MCHWGHPFSLSLSLSFVVVVVEEVPLVEFIYLVFTRMPSEFTVGDSCLLLCPLSVQRY